jgi:hypothetical protein
MMPSMATASPSLSHQRASHTWQEQNTTSVPSGSFISICMTELCPHDTQTKPVSGAFSTCPPLLKPQPYGDPQYASRGAISMDCSERSPSRPAMASTIINRASRLGCLLACPHLFRDTWIAACHLRSNTRTRRDRAGIWYMILCRT